MGTHYTTILREKNVNGTDVEEEIEIEVEYTAHRAHRGMRDSLGGKAGAGPPLEPDEDAYVEIDEVFDKDGIDIELTIQEHERILEEIEDGLADSAID